MRRRALRAQPADPQDVGRVDDRAAEGREDLGLLRQPEVGEHRRRPHPRVGREQLARITDQEGVPSPANAARSTSGSRWCVMCFW